MKLKLLYLLAILSVILHIFIVYTTISNGKNIKIIANQLEIDLVDIEILYID